MSKTDFQNGFALGFASGGVVEVEDTSRIDALEELIDQSGVLDSTERSVSEKLEELVYKFKLLYLNRGSLSLGISFENESIDYYIDLPNLTQANGFLRDNKCVKRMVGINTSKLNNLSYAFLNSVIEEIEYPFNFSSIGSSSSVQGTFNNAYYLREVRFVPETLKFSMTVSSAVLSAESVQSIIDGLAYVETAQTLTLDSAITLTDEQKATINEKGWTLAQ